MNFGTSDFFNDEKTLEQALLAINSGLRGDCSSDSDTGGTRDYSSPTVC